MPKSVESFRLSKLAISQLDQLQRWWGTSRTETVTVIIDRIYIQERNRIAMNAQDLSDEEIEEQLRQLEIEDGDKETKHADTQYSDYDETEK